jgi:hypothetical protein
MTATEPQERAFEILSEGLFFDLLILSCPAQLAQRCLGIPAARAVPSAPAAGNPADGRDAAHRSSASMIAC